MDFSNAIPSVNGKPAGGIEGFDAIVAAPEFTPIPPGIYSARVVRGEVCQTKAGGEAYRLKFEITVGEQKGKTVVRTWTFSEAAVKYTKRDLEPFGLTTAAKLLSPFPGLKEYHVRLQVALQRGNDGREFNDIKRIDIIRINDLPAGEFMIPPDEGGPK